MLSEGPVGAAAPRAPVSPGEGVMEGGVRGSCRSVFALLG